MATWSANLITETSNLLGRLPTQVNRREDDVIAHWGTPEIVSEILDDFPPNFDS